MNMQFPGRRSNHPSVVGLLLTSMLILRKDKPITGSKREDFMKQLIKDYLDHGISRRQLVSGLSALGMSGVAAKAVAQNLESARIKRRPDFRRRRPVSDL